MLLRICALLISCIFFGFVQTSFANESHPCANLLAGLDAAGFHEYLNIKSAVEETTSFDELDNRNLAGTYYPWIPEVKTVKTLTTTEIAHILPTVFEIPEKLKPSLILGKGVRHIVADLFKAYSSKGYQVLSPNDVYPVYQKLASDAGLEIIGFNTIPSLQITATNRKDRQVLIITSPLSPSGRMLSATEVQSLLAWLKTDSSRRLILDTVYTFAQKWDESTLTLLKSKQVSAIHSFAKSWILPGHLGFMVGADSDLLPSKFSPDLKLVSKALAVAKAAPEFPEVLQNSFKTRWDKVATIIKKIVPDWKPPANGYLAVVPESASTILLKHGIWTMPLSSFGSSQTGWSVVSALPDSKEELYYVTTLKNLVRGYDKYSGEYSKAGIPESSFPDKFFLLGKSELEVGLNKARAQLQKTGPSDRVLLLKTSAKSSRLLPNERTGLGRYIPDNKILVEKLFYTNEKNELVSVRLEDALADSYALNSSDFVSFEQIVPRSISILPVASACQACCKFCFSDASVSAEARKGWLTPEIIEQALKKSKERGAERVVITGGGEPTIIGFDKISSMIKLSAQYFRNRITLITNGMMLSKLPDEEILHRLLQMDTAGLSVLAISRHHHTPAANTAIMGVDTKTENILEVYKRHKDKFRNLRIRLICVLQKDGVHNESEVEKYLDWARSMGVTEVNFKELYVSTDRESEYFQSSANKYSEENRVYLRTVLQFAKHGNWKQIGALPWGAPIFEKHIDGIRMQIAAYTEPSVFWERTHGIARSWNLMADGKLLVSLETGDSEIK